MTTKNALPLHVRRSARFTCHGDGLCCTDIHQLGPVSASEKPALDAIDPNVVIRVGSLRLLRLSTAHHQRGCTFLDEAMRCRIHMHDGGRTRPRTCHRFPYVLARTPTGDRVATDHRCPCRSMGERAPIDPHAAHEALLDTRGRLSVDRRLKPRVAITPSLHVGFRRYEALEATLLARLDAIVERRSSERVEDILDVAPMQELAVGSWVQLATDLGAEPRASRWGEAFRLFGRALRWLAELDLHEKNGDPAPRLLTFTPRLWQDSFDRAEARTPFDPAARDAIVEAMLADFVADVLWAVEWPFFYSLVQLRAELVMRVAVARALTAAFERTGARPDRAMAEAIGVIEIVGVSAPWLLMVPTMLLDGPTLARSADAARGVEVPRARPAAVKTKTKAKRAHPQART